MTLAESIQGFRLRVLREAVRTGNVAATCRRYEVSRTLFYRWRTRFVQYGADGVIPKRRGPHRGRPPAVSVQDERRDRDGAGVADVRPAVCERLAGA